MSNVVVNVAVLHEGKILLTKRNDFHVWCLPSGGVDDGESLAEAAVRETKEETGVDVELTCLIGVYSRLGGVPDVNVHVVLYAAKPVGGELRIQPGETIEVKYFTPNEVPVEMAVGHGKRIADAFNERSGMSVKQEIKNVGRSIADRNEFYTLRDRAGLSSQEFYMEIIKAAKIKEVVEIENV